MIGMLPTMYPDEIIYSWMSRHVNLYGFKSAESINNNLFDKSIKQHFVYYPTYLDDFVKQIPTELSITADEIIDKHTLIPICKPFMTPEEYEILRNQIRSGPALNISAKLGLKSTSKLKNQIIKFCPICVKEDKSNNKDFWIKIFALK